MQDILIVEDGKSERDRLDRLFREAGYSVRACENVREAEQALQLEAYRIAIIDIGLSDKSGSYLFNVIKRSGKIPFIIILTGNPSVHLKQRFMDEGAIDYIVKASAQAQSDALLNRIREVIGEAQPSAESGMALEEFLLKYISSASRKLFLDVDDSYPPCKKCSSRSYLVSFARQTQMPPEVIGLVVCSGCGHPMDLEVT